MSGAAVWSVAGGMGVFLLTHIVIWRVRPSNAPRVRLLGGLAAGGMLVSALTHVSLVGFQPVELCGTLWIDLLLVTAYFFLYAGIARSVSVTLLARLRQVRHPVELEVLVKEYVSSSRFEDRISLMHQRGLLHWSPEMVTLTPKGTRLARVSRALSRVVSGGLHG